LYVISETTGRIQIKFYFGSRHVARIEEVRNAYSILVGKPEDLGVDGRIILECILGNRVGKCRLDASLSGEGPVNTVVLSGSIELVSQSVRQSTLKAVGYI
jgi:hypothetical protein